MEYSHIDQSESLIIRLLEQALTVYRLTDGLSQLGFISEEYNLDIADIVFELMGSPKKTNGGDWFYDIYIRFLANLDSRKLADRGFVKSCAVTLYHQLQKGINSPYYSSELN